MMTGIGGDVFAMVWVEKEHRLVGLNASGRAGSLMTREELVRRGRRAVPTRGPESITVPGALAGWAALLKRYGTITLAQALEPAIQLAEEGFPVSPVIARDWAAEVGVLAKDDGARATFLTAEGRAPRAGEWFRNPDYARTLRLIAKEGPAALYGGALGARIAARVRELGGFLTAEDLKANEPTWVTPISAPFRGYRVWEIPPNGQGVAALEMLRILEPYDLAAMGHNTAPYLHHLIEAKKLAFADLARFVGDADHARTATHLLSDAFIAERRSHLDPHRAIARPEPGPALTASETIYLTAADAQGNMVSFINSLFDAFGSGVVVPGTGFALHNRGSGFVLDPGLPNTVAPGKRPFHTIIPAFVTKARNPSAGGAASSPAPAGGAPSFAAEEPWLSFGVMGGAMQPQGHVQVLLNLLVFGMDLQAAVDAPRFRHMGDQRVALELPVPDSVRQALAAMGHEIVDDRTTVGIFGGAQAIMRLPQRGYVAGSDPRKDGQAAGY
jgi:gamma-glutamyltranspeptidase/glutathione hydrolase